MSKEITWEEYADELKAELDKVKKQLSIAVEVLEDIEKSRIINKLYGILRPTTD